jgi:hypothetical protein
MWKGDRFMKKIAFLIFVIFSLGGPFLSAAHSGSIELLVKDFECVEDGKIIIHYSLNNTFNFEYPNVTLGFKILEDEKPVACNESKVTVPTDADGSDILEIVINAPCSGKSYNLKSAIFYYIKRYKIDEWFSDCK